MYDFKSLSSVDFEIIVRDLLQKHMNVFLESFKSGRDKGIDLRYTRTGNSSIIIQCKHYAESGIKGLKSVLKKEAVKIKKLNPTNYILATSVELSPKYKDDILEILHPYCKSPSDIYGCAELNNLLSVHKDIEKSHYKLWLTSVNILERIVNSKIYKESEIAVEQLLSKMRLYVQNKSYNDAKKMLSTENYCIISGVPGIGKSFLAEVLLADYIRHDYEPYLITQNISEAFKVLRSDSLQVFYYDDFLGQTGLDDKLDKNEDASLLRLIEHVKNTTNTKLILTTREYILQAAKLFYERLSSDDFIHGKCIIELEKYTRENRSKILYNHLYFSSIPEEYLAEICDSDIVLKIIDHKNYSPRIIESMCKAKSYAGSTPNGFTKKFLYILDNPTMLWKHAFENQIAPPSRYILIVLASIRGAIHIEDLEEAFWSYVNIIKSKHPISISADAFINGIKELDGSFIRTERRGKVLFVGFHNPSILDYVEHFLSNDNHKINELLASSVFYEQFVTLNRLYDKQSGEIKIAQELIDDFPLLSVTVRRTISRLLPRVSIVSRDGKSSIHQQQTNSVESNILHALRVLELVEDNKAEPLRNHLLTFAIDSLNLRNPDYNKLLEIATVARISKYDVTLTNKLAKSIADSISYEADDDAFESYTLELVSDLYDNFVDILPQDYRDKVNILLTANSDMLFDYDISSATDESELEDLRTLAEKIADQFDIDLTYICKRIDDKTEELRYNMAEPYDDREEGYDDKSDEISDEDIVDMFTTLKEQ